MINLIHIEKNKKRKKLQMKRIVKRKLLLGIYQKMT